MDNINSNAIDSLNKSFSSLEKVFSEYQRTVANVLKTTGIQAIQESLNNICNSEVMKNIQTIRTTALPAGLDELQKSMSNITESIKIYQFSEISKALKAFDKIDMTILSSIPELEPFSEFANGNDIIDEDIDEMYANGEINDNDIQAEIKSIIYDEENPDNLKSEKVKNVIEKIAKKLICIIVFSLFFSPVTDTAKDKIVESLKISEFWQATGIIDWIEGWFDDDNEENLDSNGELTNNNA